MCVYVYLYKYMYIHNCIQICLCIDYFFVLRVFLCVTVCLYMCDSFMCVCGCDVDQHLCENNQDLKKWGQSGI